MILITLGLFVLITIAIVYLLYSPKYTLMKIAKKNQNTYILFSFFSGLFQLYKDSFLYHNDALYFFRQIILKNPETKAVVYNLGSTIIMNFQDADLIKEVHFNKVDCYEKFQGLLTFQYLFEKGLFMSDGNLWSQQRKLLANTFTFQSIKSRLPVTKDIVQEIYSQRNIDISKPVHILQLSEKVTSGIILKTFFGTCFRGKQVNGIEIQKELSSVLLDGFNYVQSSIYYRLKIYLLESKAAGYKPFKEEEKLILRMKNLRNAIEEIAKSRLEEIKEKNLDISQSDIFIDILLKDHLEQQNDFQLIIDQFMAFFFAGTDTTANLVSMTLYHLSQNIHIQQKLRQEIMQKINTFNDLTFENLNEMDYLLCVIKEALRIHPPAIGIIPRKVVKDHKIGDYEVKKGMIVETHFIGVMNNPKYFENPETYNPDRWLDVKKMESAPFSPFGIGKRSCIGKHLGLMSAKIMACFIVMNYNIKPNLNQPLKMNTNSIYFPSNDDLVFFEKINQINQ